MNWKIKDPKMGDIVRIYINGIWHYGIYCSDEEVIQFGFPPTDLKGLVKDEIKVVRSDMQTFCCGNFPEVSCLSVIERAGARTKKQIVCYARSKLGTGGYHILYNNCEHFVNECVFGKRKSSQVDMVRESFRLIPIIDVYIAPIPQVVDEEEVFPKEREEEINACLNQKVRRQKRFIWQLLAYALKVGQGVSIKEAGLIKSEGGKWKSDVCEVSLSHTDNYCAVCLAKFAVGVDIEELPNDKMTVPLYNKIATNEEKALLGENPSQLLIAKLWTAKESAFKRTGDRSFVPSKTPTTGQNIVTKTFFGGKLVLSVCSENTQNISVHSAQKDEVFQTTLLSADND